MSVKLLIAGESNSGKTTLTKDLENTLVINHDGKRYSFKTPNATISTFGTSEEFISFIVEKIEAYNEKFGEYPQTVVIDSVSRVFDTLYDSCNVKYTGFNIYSSLDREIKQFTSFVEDELVGNDINVILISHAIYDSDTSKHNLVGKGSFAKVGGFLSVVDESIFLETKSNKRILHFRSTKFPARTLQDSELVPDTLSVDEFNLQSHIDLLAETIESASEFSL